LIQILSLRIAKSIKNTVPDHPRSVEVLKYAISFILNTFFIITLSLLISVFTGKTNEVVVALVTYALLRQVSGGIHLKSGMLCIIISTIGITLLSFANFGQETVMTLTVASLIIAAIFSPSLIQQQTRIPSKYNPLLKLISIMMIATNFLFLSPVIAASFFIQCLTLIRGGGWKR
jgi:accessory gene regulator B